MITFEIRSYTSAYVKRTSAYNEIIDHPTVDRRMGIFFNEEKAKLILEELQDNEKQKVKICNKYNLNYNPTKYSIKQLEMKISGPLIGGFSE